MAFVVEKLVQGEWRRVGVYRGHASIHSGGYMPSFSSAEAAADWVQIAEATGLGEALRGSTLRYVEAPGEEKAKAAD